MPEKLLENQGKGKKYEENEENEERSEEKNEENLKKKELLSSPISIASHSGQVVFVVLVVVVVWCLLGEVILFSLVVQVVWEQRERGSSQQGNLVVVVVVDVVVAGVVQSNSGVISEGHLERSKSRNDGEDYLSLRMIQNSAMKKKEKIPAQKETSFSS